MRIREKGSSVRGVLLLIFWVIGHNLAWAQSPIENFWQLDKLKLGGNSRCIGTEDKVVSILLESVHYLGKPTEVFAYYASPATIMKVDKKKQFPAVVLVHGGGGKAYKEWVLKWAAEGYAAIAIDLSGNDGQGNRLVNAGPDQKDENKFLTIESGELQDVWVYHAVSSVILAHSWLIGREDVDVGNTFITGISWGGFLTNIVASLDDRFRAAAPVYGCGFLNESDTFKNWLAKLPEKYKEKWIKYFDPSSYLADATVPFFFMNGNTDKHFNILPYHKTYSLVPSSRRFLAITPDMKHGHYEGWLPKEIKYYFDSFVHPNAPLPSVENAKVDGQHVSAQYEGTVPVLSARFYFTSDADTTNEHRKWLSVGVKFDPITKALTGDIPPEGFRYGFFYVKDHRDLGVSSEVLVN